ncbi:MAG TPA: hypothetical protein PLP65_06185 [Bacteroidales bacterium]|nr:hypothetical protein [Bacteroidales bacterium]
MKKVSYYLLGLMFVSLLTVQAFAQPSKGGTPPSFSIQSSTDIFEEKIVAPIDIDQAIQEDAARGGALWAGRSIQVDYSMSNSGTWTVMPDGTKIWRLKITTSGAKAVGLAYDHFYIPKGGKLYIYNEYRTQVLGAYDETTNPSGGLFSTELVQGSIVNIEYVAPKNLPVKPIKNEFKGNVEGDKISPANFTIKPENPRIDISELIYVYRNVPFLDRYDLTKTTGFGASGSCEVNVNCSEGASWQTEKRGVAEIWLKNGASWGWCTGGLVNTTNNSGIPYFLTADHCHGLPDAGEPYASAADMTQW